MTIRAWLQKLRGREDAAVVERAETMAVETPEERRLTEEGVEGVAADERATRALRETPEEAERLADAE